MDPSTENVPAPPRRRSVSAVVVVLVLLVAAACGGGGDDDDDEGVATLTDAGTDDTATDDDDDVDVVRSDEESALEFSVCMREGGVADFPDPEVTQDGSVTYPVAELLAIDFESASLAESFVACSPLIADVTFGGQLGTIVSGLQDTVVEHGDCLRDEGLDVGDVDLAAGGIAPAAGDGDRVEFIAGLYGIDADDPAVVAAIEACDSVLAGLGGGAG